MAPVAFNKWLSGSVEQDAAEVVRAAFDQAHARDPLHARDWVVLVDEHCVHSPISEPLDWHAGVGTEHWASLVHPSH